MLSTVVPYVTKGPWFSTTRVGLEAMFFLREGGKLLMVGAGILGALPVCLPRVPISEVTSGGGSKST